MYLEITDLLINGESVGVDIFDVMTIILYENGQFYNNYQTITFLKEPDNFVPNETAAIAWLEANAT
mgnify:CR=1 FL=1